MQEKELTNFYSDHSDEIIKKRVHSSYALRRYVHEAQYESVAKYVPKGARVLDAGCGEGALSVLLAERGVTVVGTDISKPNIERAQAFAKERGVTIPFSVADASALPFEDQSFDVVISSHVLEHLPDFDAGLRELLRVSRGRVIFAVPTALSALSFVQLGHGWFYVLSLRSLFAFFVGVGRVLYALISRADGVNETYAGTDAPHVFRFPWVVRRHIARAGARLVHQEASTLAPPFFGMLVPLARFIDQYRGMPVLKELGYGTTFVIER